MAATALGNRLTETHRQRQLLLQRASLRQYLTIWRALDPGNLRDTWEPFETAALALMLARRRDSVGLASGYYQAFRQAEGVPGVARIQVAPAILEQMRTSLRVTGFSTILRLEAQNHPNPGQIALVRTSGAVARQVANGGRETIVETVRADRRALGYARVTSADPCSFCAMLAARGPVFGEQSVEFEAHDNDACTGEPVFSRDQPWPGRAREFQQQWNETTHGLSGADARRAFRQVIEDRS